LSHIIHDWTDARSTTILHAIHRACRSRNARVVLIEQEWGGPRRANRVSLFVEGCSDLEKMLVPGAAVSRGRRPEYRDLFAG
jgi:hypothetical protein